jgi:ankyrin repeat protein
LESKTPKKETELIPDRLYEATIEGNEEVIISILEKNKEYVNYVYKEYKSASLLHVAAISNQKKIVSILIETFGANIAALDILKRSVLHIACSSGNREIVYLILGNGGDPNLRGKPNNNKKDMYGYSPLHITLRNNNFEIAEDLILFGANINFKKNNGQNCLHECMINGNIKRLEWILKQKNIQINTKDTNSETPLQVSQFKLNQVGVFNGNVELVETLMNNFQCDINCKNDKGRNIIHIAAYNGKTGMLKLMQKKYLNSLKDRINDPDFKKNTPLHLSVLNNHFNCVRVLLKFSNINIDSQNIDLDTPMHIALRKNHNIIALLLNEKGSILLN